MPSINKKFKDIEVGEKLYYLPLGPNTSGIQALIGDEVKDKGPYELPEDKKHKLKGKWVLLTVYKKSDALPLIQDRVTRKVDMEAWPLQQFILPADESMVITGGMTYAVATTKEELITWMHKVK